MKITKYVYSKKDCPKCWMLENELKAYHVSFIKRDAERLYKDSRIFDDIDLHAYNKLQKQALIFPVIIDMVEEPLMSCSDLEKI